MKNSHLLYSVSVNGVLVKVQHLTCMLLYYLYISCLTHLCYIPTAISWGCWCLLGLLWVVLLLVAYASAANVCAIQISLTVYRQILKRATVVFCFYITDWTVCLMMSEIEAQCFRKSIVTAVKTEYCDGFGSVQFVVGRFNWYLVVVFFVNIIASSCITGVHA